MNSKQGSRYIKRRMGNDLKNEILAHNGIVTDVGLERKPSVLACSRCNHVNGIDYQYCSTCSYPLVTSAFERIKEEENSKIKSLELKHEQDMKALREEMDLNFKEIMSMIRENDRLRYVKPEVLSAKAKQRRTV
jgi:hypothetical protein